MKFDVFLNFFIWTSWCPVFAVCEVSEVLGEAGRGFVSGRSCSGPHTCSTLSLISTCT